MEDTEYIVIFDGGGVIFVEITEERREIIDRLGDVAEYVDVILSEELDFSPNNRDWTLTCESMIACYGKIPKITN